MTLGKNIRKIRDSKGMTAKEVVTSAGLAAAMYSRIENDVTEPSLTSLEKIAKALGVKVADLLNTDNPLDDIRSFDGSLMEKVKMIDTLSDDEKKTVYNIVDAFVSKRKLRDALSGVLEDAK